MRITVPSLKSLRRCQYCGLAFFEKKEKHRWRPHCCIFHPIWVWQIILKKKWRGRLANVCSILLASTTLLTTNRNNCMKGHGLTSFCQCYIFPEKNQQHCPACEYFRPILVTLELACQMISKPVLLLEIFWPERSLHLGRHCCMFQRLEAVAVQNPKATEAKVG